MNATSSIRRHVTAHPRRRQARPIWRGGLRPSVTPRVVLHLLVGALTLVSVQALLKPLTRSWEAAMTATVAYAEQQASSSATIVAPSLSTGTAASAQSVQQSSGRSDVMTDLSSTIGRTGASTVSTWRGIAGQDVNFRAAPNRSQPPIGELKAGTSVEVVNWVSGEEVESHNNTWAELSDGTYVFSMSLRRAAVGAPPALTADAPAEGRWVDVNLTEQIATAYEGRTAVRSALISSGRPGWETPIGVFPVLRRIEKDTMDGATLVGQGPNGAGASYKVDNVRYVQYFTSDGAAIHENYWRRPATFGMPGSHGCIGMAPADAAWYWEFAAVGTPLVIHE
jgi:lipoprotein-anchoring transpeptidase ErfK/SrfK